MSLYIEPQFQQSQHSELSSDAISIKQQRSAELGASHTDSTNSECQKPALKLPPNHAVEEWCRADDFINCEVIFQQKNVIIAQKSRANQ